MITYMGDDAMRIRVEWERVTTNEALALRSVLREDMDGRSLDMLMRDLSYLIRNSTLPSRYGTNTP